MFCGSTKSRGRSGSPLRQLMLSLFDSGLLQSNEFLVLAVSPEPESTAMATQFDIGDGRDRIARWAYRYVFSVEYTHDRAKPSHGWDTALRNLTGKAAVTGQPSGNQTHVSTPTVKLSYEWRKRQSKGDKVCPLREAPAPH